MHAELIDVVACPACKGPLTTDDIRDGHCVDGVLRCAACCVAIPVAKGFVLFGEARLDDGRADTQWVASASKKWFQTDEAYAAFLATKANRRVYDAYAMFQPFNESLRALLAVIEPIRASLRPGDTILDTWSRTGWPGAWLASIFPEQRVVSIWEGDSNVLGYSGFAYWLGEGERPSNWDVVFTSADEPLPFRTGAFAVLHGYESLHRYRQASFLSEARRVTAADGTLVFSHIHLSNNEPDPWFQRGCVQHHGTLYRGVFDRLYEGTNRKAFVLGERTLFECGESFTLRDVPNTDDYNAAIIVGAADWEGKTFTTEHTQPVTDRSHLIVNPLFDFDLAVGRVSWHREGREGQVAHILDRHPCYEDRIEAVREGVLTGRQPELVYYAGQAWTFGQVAKRLGGDTEALRAEAADLVQREILWPATVGYPVARLQHYFGTVEILDPEADSFAALWASLAARYEERPIIETEDGTEFTWEVVDELVSATLGWLLEATAHGDRVLIHAPNCPEAYVLMWACWLSGRVVVPVEPDLSVEAVEASIARAKPTLAFGMQALSVPTYEFDSLASESSTLPAFSEGIGDYLEKPAPPLPTEDPQADAAILFTSGSTGRPKGVRLSLGALTSSGGELARHFGWRPGDRLFSGGASYSMSGLRNPALGGLQAAATIVLPDPGPMNPIRAYALLREHSISVVTTVPTQLSMWVAMRERLKDQPFPTTLRSIAYTGYGISDAVRQEVAQWLDVEVTGYYGLTETCGLCLADHRGERAEGNIGHPAAALAQVVDAEGVVCADGERGELRICSPRIMSGYLEADTVSTVRLERGWLYTGDAAIRMPDGSFELVGRFDDQVKDRYGATVFPSEVEGVAAELRSIGDCCCLAIEGAGDAASLVLFIVLADGAEAKAVEAEVLEAVDTTLGVRKRPSRLVFCESLPRKTSGKVDRALLLQQVGMN